MTYPAWMSGDVDADQFAVHELDDNSWAGCLAAVSRLAEDQLDPRVRAWRLHVFTPVDGVPAASGAGTVAVLQISHVLADGARSSALAAWLFGRAGDVPPVTPPRRAASSLPWRSFAGRAGASPIGSRHRSGSGARAGGFAAGAAEQRPPVRRAQRAHPGPAPRPTARSDGDGRCVVRGIHGAVRSSARAWRRSVDAGRRGADGESRCPRGA